jgi:hypothetical protein
MRNADQLLQAAKRDPNVVVIAQTKGKAPPPLPPGFHQELRLTAPGQIYEVYRVVGR